MKKDEFFRLYCLRRMSTGYRQHNKVVKRKKLTLKQNFILIIIIILIFYLNTV